MRRLRSAESRIFLVGGREPPVTVAAEHAENVELTVTDDSAAMACVVNAMSIQETVSLEYRLEKGGKLSSSREAREKERDWGGQG